MMNIVTIDDKRASAILKQRVKPVDLSKFKRGELQTLIKEMRATMREADGVGLSANQIGLDMSLFVAETPAEKGKSKFYALINPEIIKRSTETVPLEEGCLSIPEMFGEVLRSERITVTGTLPNGKRVKIKARGFLARIFQHEIDHLNGYLISDRSKKLKRYEKPKQ